VARPSQPPKPVEDRVSGGPILTIGHSTRSLEDFIALLRGHGVERLVDIRTIPRSRRNPQFNSDMLSKSLQRAGMAYAHLKELGGLRHPRRDSINTGWRNASFRGYADYMQTSDFTEALSRLLQLCAAQRCAVMCAEALPWRCHRSLLADALVARGVPVEHILGAARRQAHSLTPFARIENNRVTYPQPVGEAQRKKPAAAQAGLKFEESEAPMPAKRRKAKFTAAKEARRRARLAAGTPPTGRVIADKRRKPPKHKKSLDDLSDW
jgi:Protein of unknown function, DUF488